MATLKKLDPDPVALLNLLERWRSKRKRQGG
jgi:hypothetical protein